MSSTSAGRCNACAALRESSFPRRPRQGLWSVAAPLGYNQQLSVHRCFELRHVPQVFKPTAGFVEDRWSLATRACIQPSNSLSLQITSGGGLIMGRTGFGLVAAALVVACEPGVCPSNTMQVGERCIVKMHAGVLAQAKRGRGRVAADSGAELAGQVALPVGSMRADGEACSGDGDCASGHCDLVCCAKGSDCCRTLADCKTFVKGVGMSCEDRAHCRGVAGKMICGDGFRCLVVDGIRNDTACSPRVEADDCGDYPAVYCSGQQQQTGPPACATSCKDASGCDPESHCVDGECLADLADGEACDEGGECVHGRCRNSRCCGEAGDCCKTAADCPTVYSQAATCTDPSACHGAERVAVCSANRCSSVQVAADQACNGKSGPTCGTFRDVICGTAATNACLTNCVKSADCDAGAICAAGRCVITRAN
jgi:hypothetical protein